MLDGELGEAAQSDGLLDDGEGGADHGLAGNAGGRRGKHKHKLQGTATLADLGCSEGRCGSGQLEKAVLTMAWLHIYPIRNMNAYYAVHANTWYCSQGSSVMPENVSNKHAM